MADTRTPAQTAMGTEIPAQWSAAVRDFQERYRTPLLDAIHRAETGLVQWTDRPATDTAASAAEGARLLLDDGEIGEALTRLREAAEREAQEPLAEHPFAEAATGMETAWAEWRERHGLPEDALPRTYPFTTEERAKVPGAISEANSMPPAMSEEEWAHLEQMQKTNPGQPDATVPPLDLPDDQEAAELAARRDAEEQEARVLLAGKSPEVASEKDTGNAVEQPEEALEAAHPTSPQTDALGQEGQAPTARRETLPAEPETRDPGSPSPQETHINGKNVTIRSAGFLTTLAQGFNQRRDLLLKSREEKQKAQRQDAAREKFSDFTATAHDLEHQSEALLHHPVMEAVRQAAPKGLDHADAQQKALVGSIVSSNPEFQSQVQALQNQHAEVTRRFDALEPELDEIPVKERRAYTDITDRHLKKAEEHLQQLPDQKGGSIWERLKESFRAIGQRLGITGPDLDVQRQVTTPPTAPAAVQTPRPGRH